MLRRSAAVLTALAASVAIAISGCSGPLPGEQPSTGFSVVATTTQLGDFARSVVGDTVPVTQLLPPNGSAHGFEPSPADLLALGRADALVMNGGGLEGWLDGAIEASGFDGVIIESADSITRTLDDPDDDDHADDDHVDSDHAGDDHADADHADDDHADHDHDGIDPHFWTSIRNAVEIVHGIADALAEAAPEHAARFHANGDAYVERLEQLDAWASAQFARVPPAERLLVSNHDSLRWFNADYDITFVGAVIPSFDDNAELAAADIDALVRAIRESGAKAVFAEASLSPAAARTIADEAGVRVFAGDEALYVDSLAPAGSPAATYIGAQLHNVEALMSGFGVEAEPAPAELRGAQR